MEGLTYRNQPANQPTSPTGEAREANSEVLSPWPPSPGLEGKAVLLQRHLLGTGNSTARPCPLSSLTFPTNSWQVFVAQSP